MRPTDTNLKEFRSTLLTPNASLPKTLQPNCWIRSQKGIPLTCMLCLCITFISHSLSRGKASFAKGARNPFQVLCINAWRAMNTFSTNLADLEVVRQSCPKNLRASKEATEYEIRPEKQKRCETCELNNKDFSVSCRDCIFKTNMEGKFLPLIINHGSHPHPLNLIMMPTSYDYKFRCCGCGELGKSISYRCYDCNFNLHVGCVLLEPTASSSRHRHSLTLVYDSLEDTYWDNNICGFCNNERNRDHWFYYCSTCEIVAHIGCFVVD
ncbi:hypothetical protein E1A91_A04G038100v1 [Gossypium mustelinum]|uniref:DC1 domain-containing protein n=1 Tax=Gossypium mustelinum TaxID=34275 RepID=A0A5D2ZN11_GOSMU|nr:hypothetical protein E1A91_A04G038100v1 [Gossypium mustelinum]